MLARGQHDAAVAGAVQRTGQPGCGREGHQADDAAESTEATDDAESTDGATATKNLVAMIRGAQPTSSRPLVLPSKLVVRQSSRVLETPTLRRR